MYAYAFLKTPDQTATLPKGIEATSTLVICNQLAALVESNLSVEHLRQSDERLMRAVIDHDRVIQELFDMTTVLPLRFGTVFLSQQHLMDHLQEKHDDYVAQLDRVQGKAEYLIKLIPIPLIEDNHDEAQTGRNYFLAKKQRYQAQAQYKQQQQQELHDCLVFFQNQGFEVIQGAGTEEVERIYVLGDRHQPSLLRQLLQDQIDQYSSWQIQLSNALPPYHFVT